MAQMETAMVQADASHVGTPDADFIRLMVPHHQGAIEMAKAVLLHGTDPALKNIVQGIIAEQTNEITYLQNLAKLKASPAGTAIGQTLGPVRSPETAAPAAGGKPECVPAFLILQPTDASAAAPLLQTQLP